MLRSHSGSLAPASSIFMFCSAQTSATYAHCEKICFYKFCNFIPPVSVSCSEALLINLVNLYVRFMGPVNGKIIPTVKETPRDHSC